MKSPAEMLQMALDACAGASNDHDYICECRPVDVRRVLAEIERLKLACEIYRKASITCHMGHFDRMGTRGLNCPECLRADSLRDEADRVLKGATAV